MARMPNRADVEAAVDAAINLGKAQAKALAALPGAINAVAEAANNINATANEARAVIRRAQAVTDRLDSMLDHVEPAVSEITPTLQALKEAQQRIVAMTGSTEKLASFVDDAGAGLSRLAGLSGASGLFNRIAAATKPTEPGSRPLSSVPSEPIGEILPADTPSEEVLAELVAADLPPVELDDPEIHDAELAEEELAEEAPAEEAPAETPADEEPAEAPSVAAYDYFGHTSSSHGNDASHKGDDQDDIAEPLPDQPLPDQPLPDQPLPDDPPHPVELGSEADGPDVTESAAG